MGVTFTFVDMSLNAGYANSCGIVNLAPLKNLEFEDLGQNIAADYTGQVRRIRVNRKISHYSDDDLVDLMAHEVVHAMFGQAELRRYGGAPEYTGYGLSEEIAPDILGAHIAGQVRSGAGGDGAALTDRLVRRHRNLSDPTLPVSYHQRFDRAWASFGPNAVDPEFEYVVSTHYGSPEQAEEVGRICRENPEPWDAAREISERFLTWEGENASLRDRLATLATED